MPGTRPSTPSASRRPHNATSPPRPVEVVEEERLLATVLDNLRRLSQAPDAADHEAKLLELRDSLAEEKLVDDVASLVEEMDRTQALMAQQARSSVGTVELGNPYFAHMLLDDDHGRRSILIGKRTFISDRVRIVDWRNAPISRVFYQYAEGDEYDETINGRRVSGSVEVRRTVSVERGRLLQVANDDHRWIRGDDDRWVDARALEARLAGGAGAAIRPSSLGAGLVSRSDKHLREITPLLDPEQFAAITRPASGLVIIQGGAGSGKTTVGLHRIAYLHFQDPKGFTPTRMAVIVFSKALASYIKHVLPALGVEGVQVLRYDGWAAALRKRHFRDLPDRYSDETPALVSRFKTHTALLRMLEEVGRRNRGGDPLLIFEDTFTDRGWIADGLERWAPGEFSDKQITKIHRWCTLNHFIRVDGGGPHEHELPCLDREDDTILLRLHQLMRGPLRYQRSRNHLRYHHVMVDEAQDMSPLELAVVLDTAGPRRSVTFAGDSAQSVIAHRDPSAWTDVVEALSLDVQRVSPLQVSYRSTQPIMRAARAVLGPLAPADELVAPRDGLPVAHLAFAGMGEAVTWLAPALTDLVHREPTANVALLTATLGEAVPWYQALERAEVPNFALVADQDFSFAPGIEVTDVRSAKGLEFDYVVVLGANAGSFPDTRAGRHLLHVAATRAAHQLWFVSDGVPSPLIPEEGLAGLLG